MVQITDTLKNTNYLLLAAGGLYVALLLSISLNLQSIPSCIFGCDYYFEQGGVLHASENSFFSSSSSTHLGHLSQGPQIYYYLSSILVNLGLSLIQTSTVISLIGIAFSLALLYKVFERVSGSREIAIACSLIAFELSSLPIFKYSEFAKVFSVPLFLYLFFYHLDKRSMKSAAMLGLGMGIMGLSHANAFFIPYFFIASYFIVEFLLQKDKSKDGLLKWLRSEMPGFGAAIGLGFLISLIWWFKPIFIYYGSPYLGFGFNTYNLQDMQVCIWYFIELLNRVFLNLSSARGIILSLIVVVGAYFTYAQWKGGTVKKEILYVAFAFMIGVFHFIITSPLLGKDLSPDHSMMFLYAPTAAFLAIALLSDERGRKFIIPLILILVALNSIELLDKKNDRFFSGGYNEIPQMYSSLSSWLKANTSMDDVFLSSNELCFAVNGLSGRKCLEIRRGHSSKFDQIDTSYVAAAVILYGNNTQEKIRLAKEFNVTYIYWDAQWISTEFSQQENGALAWFDPIMIIYTPEREMALKENGVKYSVMTTWLDPSFRDWRFRKFKVILVTPDNYYGANHPWKPDIDKYLDQVWSYGSDAAVFKFNAS